MHSIGLQLKSSSLVLQSKNLPQWQDSAVWLIGAVNGSPSDAFEGRGVLSKSATPKRNRAKLQRALIAVVKASREDADISRQELAKRVGLTYSQIVNIENGRREISFVDFVMIAEAIGKDSGELMKRVSSW